MESCVNCGNRYKVEKCDYSQGGCIHTNMDGFICMAFADEGVACYMVGLKDGRCECWRGNDEALSLKAMDAWNRRKADG